MDQITVNGITIKVGDIWTNHDLWYYKITRISEEWIHGVGVGDTKHTCGNVPEKFIEWFKYVDNGGKAKETPPFADFTCTDCVCCDDNIYSPLPFPDEKISMIKCRWNHNGFTKRSTDKCWRGYKATKEENG